MKPVFTMAALVFVLGAACSRRAPASQSGTATGSSEHGPELPAMTVDDLAAMLTRHETVAVYDANAQERYTQGHIPTARHVGHDEVTAAILPQNRATRLVFYCANEH